MGRKVVGHSWSCLNRMFDEMRGRVVRVENCSCWGAWTRSGIGGDW